jgi:hypothetical protein
MSIVREFFSASSFADMTTEQRFIISGIAKPEWNGESFTKNVISYGPFGEGKGTGIYFAIADMHKTGRKDIVVAGKDGLYIFFNEKP